MKEGVTSSIPSLAEQEKAEAASLEVGLSVFLKCGREIGDCQTSVSVFRHLPLFVLVGTKRGLAHVMSKKQVLDLWSLASVCEAQYFFNI